MHESGFRGGGKLARLHRSGSRAPPGTAQGDRVRAFSELRLLPPTPERVERLIHSACATAEQQFFADTFTRFSDTSRTRLDALLTSSLEAEENEEAVLDVAAEEAEEDEETIPLDQVTWHDLKLNPGPVGVKSVRQELAKLRL